MSGKYIIYENELFLTIKIGVTNVSGDTIYKKLYYKNIIF